ncbi:MAG: translation initiation factor IF-2, partial [Deltaproteobacteria bacterium]|nr:translation initiation factor IF-2 [Deltaproteobacteria bacterium]
MTIRVFELAKELRIPAKDVIDRTASLGFKVQDIFTELTKEQISQIKLDLKKPVKKDEKATQPATSEIHKPRRIISTKKSRAVPKEKEPAQENEKPEPGTIKVASLKKNEQTSESEDSGKVRKRVISLREKPDSKQKDTKQPDSKQKEKDLTKESAKVSVKNKISADNKTVIKEKEERKKSPVEKIKKTIAVNDFDDDDDDDSPKKKIGFIKKEKLPRKIDIKSGKIAVFNDDDEDEDVVEDVTEAAPQTFHREQFVFSGDTKKKKRHQTKKRPGKWMKQRGGFAGEEPPEQKHQFSPRKKAIVVGESVTVGELASLIGVKVSAIIRTLMSLDIMATITQTIDGETAALVAEEHNIEIKIERKSIEDSIVQEEDQEKDLVARPPVVTIMGHVDHGKTSLLDKIRSSKISDAEAGGITQHIGAYQVDSEQGSFTFLDTPGHEAFTAMRARGANVTDIVVLVVAADDGPRPQTKEAVNHAKAAGVPIIVAINKCDKPDANPDKTIQQLMELELIAESFGGDTSMIQVSAHTGEGVDKLLEVIQLQAEIMELKANPDCLAEGVVIESRVDKGKGNASTILIQRGTLKIGDCYVVGNEFGKVRGMWNEHGKKLLAAPPSTPVEIVGLNGIPHSGDPFNVGSDEKQVRQIASLRAEKEKERLQSKQDKVSLENVFDVVKQSEKAELKLIIKADVIGSLEALTDSLKNLGNDEVSVRIIHGAVGGISIT